MGPTPPTLSTPHFIKPADPLAKSFDAGVYHSRHQIRLRHPLPPTTPVLISDPVEWLAEYRCFILEGTVVASSPYLSFGRPLRHSPEAAPVLPAPVLDVCRRLTLPPSPPLPPAFVVDVGLIEDRGWAVVEFNPPWCSGLLSANPSKVLDVLHRSCRPTTHLTPSDQKWLLRRP